jgi:hypothetical protein
MSVMTVIAAGQQGLLFHAVGGAIGVDEPVAHDALERLLRVLARRLSARAADPREHEILLDVIARGDFGRFIDDPRALLGRAAVRDGEQILAYLYGSVEAARKEAKAIGPPEGLDVEMFARLTTLAASLLLGAMARQLEQQARDHSAVPGPAGVLKQLGETFLRGFAEGTMRSIRPAGFRRRMALRRLGLRLRRQHHGLTIDELLAGFLDDPAT